jgi:hypothetical protein
MVESPRQQRLDAILRRGTLHRCDEGIPFGRDFRIRWQARGVDKALGLGDGLLVE